MRSGGSRDTASTASPAFIRSWAVVMASRRLAKGKPRTHPRRSRPSRPSGPPGTPIRHPCGRWTVGGPWPNPFERETGLQWSRALAGRSVFYLTTWPLFPRRAFLPLRHRTRHPTGRVGAVLRPEVRHNWQSSKVSLPFVQKRAVAPKVIPHDVDNSVTGLRSAAYVISMTMPNIKAVTLDC